MNISISHLACVLEQIDLANSQDPDIALFDGKLLPKAFIYSQHMTRWLFVLDSAPSELMQIACRAQHIERWKMPRASYPEGRAGYYQWRIACGQMHGKRTAELMAVCAYSAEACEQVETILSKRQLRNDADTQLLEDVACLVFLEQYFAEFYEQNQDYSEEQWLRIVRRTWDKMSERGQQQALKLASHLPAHLLALLKEALQ